MFLLADSILHLAHLVLVKIYSWQKISPRRKLIQIELECNQMGRHVLAASQTTATALECAPRWLNAFKLLNVEFVQN